MDDFDPHPAPGIPQRPVKARGAPGNVAHRFSVETRHAEDDGWEPAAPANPRTRLLVDRARSIISRNKSPDIGFDQSANPYRGCEHGCIYCYARPTHAFLLEKIIQRNFDKKNKRDAERHINNKKLNP